jgi:hypothetical protein
MSTATAIKIKPFKFKYKIKEGENCFSYLKHFVAEMDKAAQEYLDQFEFVPSDKIADAIWKLVQDAFTAVDDDWDKVPDWAADLMDCGVPYCGPSRDGSLWYSLGLSVVSQDAHLRNLWENIKNDTNNILPFPVVVPKDIEDHHS